MTVKGKGKQVARKAPASSSSSSSKRKNPISVGESSSAQPKKKRSGVLQFVDDAAADADHDGKDEDDDLEWEDLDDFEFEVKNLSKGSGKPSLIPFFIKEEEMDDVELEEAIKERYLQGSQFVSYDEDVKECDDPELVAHTMKDLTFWRVKCAIGRERQAAFCLMQKFVDLQKIGKKLQIFSVFAIEHVKGFVYIEADKVSNVLEACNGLCILYPSRIVLVPSSEAPTLLAIQNKACGISKGMWVRMKSGKYKGDLAEVVFVNDVKKRATIKLVPRIDLQAIAKKFGGGTSLKASPMPAPRLISSHELEDFRPYLQVSRDRETGEIFEVLDGLMLKDGYLYKKVSTCSLIYWGVQPSSAELVKFEQMGKDEVKDVSWLSSVYKARMKKKLPETSNQKNGDKSNPKDGDKKGSGFEIDDLVLFGKKDCGIIVDKENDSFKILKGDVTGSEVVTIRIQEIKKNCVDKVFTAADRCNKTISIDDIVKVFEGPLEGREGIVRHMYKGFLFIYDECQSENNGFFCAKSGMCDLVKKSREFYGGKSGSKAGASFAQSPIISAEQADNSQSFSRNRQSNTRGTFSVGQTLRIRKGPLKGYLCRVIRIYRADVTVKLDSLAKLLTVDEKLLSFANSKRDDSTAMPSDIFGAEEPSIGGVQDERRGLEMDNCQMNDGMSSFGRDSWGAPSSSNFAFAPENDNKDQDQGADPWGCKLSSLNGAQEQGVNNSWGKALCPIAEQSSWNKMESENNDGDAWNKASTKSDTASVAWKNDIPSSLETEQTWSMKGGSNGWGVAAKNATDGCSDSGGWSTAELTDPGDRQTLGENGWNRPAKASTLSITETSGWEKSKPPSSDAGGSWNTKGASADWNKEASGKDKSGSFGGQSSNCACQKSGGDKQDSWDIKGKDLLKNDDNWGQFTASDEKTPVASDPWDRSFDCAIPIKAWETISTDGNQAADWGVSASSVELRTQMSSCDKAKVAPSSTGWEKLEAGVTEAGGWKKTSDVNEAAGWVSSAMNSEKVKTLSSASVWGRSNEASPTETEGWKKTADYNQVAGCVSVMLSAVEHGNQTSSRGKVKTPPTSSGWEKPKQVGSAETGGWKNGLSNQTKIDERNKEKSSGMDQASGWNIASNKDSGQDGFWDRWDKAKNFEGHGQENHKESKASDHWQKDQHDANFGKPTDSDWSQGSGLSQGHSRNGNGKNWEQGIYWNQQRDFDGGRGSSMGRERARYGVRGSRNENDFEKPGDSDEGGRSGEGGGRFGYGVGGYRRDNSDDTRQLGGGIGRSRGRDQGQFESSDWRSRCGGRFGCGAGGYRRDNSDDTRQLGRGIGRGRGRDQGQFESYDWRSRCERVDDGGFPNRQSSGLGGDEDGGWVKSTLNSGEISAGATDGNSGWSCWKSFDGVSTPQVTDPQDAIGSENEPTLSKLTGSGQEKDSFGNQSSDWGNGGRNNWSKQKTSDAYEKRAWNNALEGSKEGGYLGESGNWRGRSEFGRGWSSIWGDQGRSSSWGGDEDGGWGKSTLNGSKISAGAMDGNSGWSSQKSFGGVSKPHVTDPQDAVGSENEPTFRKSTWMGQEKDSFGNQSSNWGNGGGNNWSMQKTSDAYEKSAWSNTLESSKEGGYQGQSGNCRGRSEFGRGRSSNWGGDEDSGWGKSTLNHSEISAGAMDGNSGWSSWKSFGGVSTPQVTDPQDAIGSENEPTFSKLTGSGQEKDSFGNQSSDWGNGGRNNWSKQTTSDAYEKPALNNTLEGSKEGGYLGQLRNWRGRSEFGRGWSSIWGDKGRSSSRGGDEESGLGKSTLNGSEISAGAMDGNSGWSCWKSFGGVSTPQVTDPQDAIGSENEPTFIKSTGSGQEKNSFGNQSSDWGNGGGNNWSKQKTSDAYEKPSWNNTLEGYKEGRYQGQSGNLRGRSEFGRDRSSGGRGRGNSFSGSGYGLGINSGGKGSQNTGGHAEMGSQGSWKADVNSKPVSWTYDGSRWTAVSAASKGESSKSGWEADVKSKPASWTEGPGWPAASAASKGESSKSGCDPATDFGSQGASVLGSASAKGFEVDITDGTGRAGGWSSTKEAGSSSEQKDDPWGSSNARKGGQESRWNKEGCGWNTGSSPKAAKEAYEGESPFYMTWKWFGLR